MRTPRPGSLERFSGGTSVQAWLAPALAVSVVLIASCVPPEPTPRHGAYEDVRRVVALLDDVAAEYPRAVAGGRVTDAPRLRVVETMLHDAALFAHRFAPDDQRALHDLAELAKTRREPEQFRERARAQRRQLVASYRLVLAPPAPPDRARAQALWDWLCAGCHGIVGMGDGPQGLDLSPEPKDFHEAAFMAELAPSRAFNQIADGVRGTAMPQWGLFSASERWGLAFLVFAFRHEPAAVARGRVLVATRGIPSSMSAVADRTDGQLLEAAKRRGLTDREAADVLAYLRAEAPFAWTTGPLVAVRGALAELAVSYRARGTQPAALLASARDLLAPSFVAIRAARPATAARIEQTLVELARSIDGGALEDVVDRHVVKLGPLLDQAEAVMREPTPWSGALRLAAEWLLAASIALGCWFRVLRPSAASASATLGTLAVAAVGACTIATGATAIVQLVAIATLLFTCVLAFRRASLVRVLILALLVGSVAGPLLVGVQGMPARALVVAVVAVGVVLGYAVHAVPRVATAATAVAFVIAGASIAARAVEAISGAGTLRIPRIEALGILPSIAALATAGVVALALSGIAGRAARGASGQP